MNVWNNDISSNETGAPYIRSIPYYIVTGNHDTGGNGDRANLLGDDNAGRFTGNVNSGDALEYYNNYYFPLHGTTGVDPQYVFNGDSKTNDGFYFTYQGKTYSSPDAIETFRNSTTVDTGQGTKRQIDHMSNYSFDSGNAHFTFLDANPHLFNALFSYDPTYQTPPSNFPNDPSVLRDWLINDLDSSNQPWKIVVFHQPPFSSGNATLRALDRVADTPTTQAAPAVAVDTNYNGVDKAVPDGVIYVVEGAEGDRDFDNSLDQPRGQGAGVDQEDSATGSYIFSNGLTFANGPASWLDTNLTNN